MNVTSGITVNYYVATATTYNNDAPESDTSYLSSVIVSTGNNASSSFDIDVSGCAGLLGSNSLAAKSTAKTGTVKTATVGAHPNSLPGDGAADAILTSTKVPQHIFIVGNI